MPLQSTIFGRLGKLLHVRYGVDTADIRVGSALGQRPIGLTEATIRGEFRVRLNVWFADLIPPFADVSWDQHTAVARLADDVLARSRMTTIKKYRMHVMSMADVSFSRAAGAGAQTVSLSDRQRVRDAMNADLQAMLIGRISLDDLGGDVPTILANVVDRMVV